jgi:hypothetical protein
MPNFDAGHYFLTVAAPVRMDSVLIGGQSHSRRHLIREALAALPAGEHTVVTLGKGNAGPFARSTRTHFVRFVVLDDVVFNGRIPANTLIDKIKKTNLLKPQPVDRLSTPFLILAVDFDAGNGTDGELHGYLADLWQRASAELTGIFQHCQGFESVKTAQEFCRYISRCQVETTMPFNDYWSAPPALTNLDLVPYVAAAGAGVLVGVVGLVVGYRWLFFAGLLLLLLAIYLGYRKVIDVGQSPFPKSAPPAPGGDLPTVLKALYLQRAFTDFAIGAQGASDQEIFDRFGKFAAEHAVDRTDAPTQPPGVIGV